jgi:hypothetical protein
MKFLNYFVIALFLLISVSACSTARVQRTKSGFDNVEVLSVKPSIFRMDGKMAMGFMWDETMPTKYKNQYANMGILILNGQYKTSENTSVNFNIDGNKYTLKILDTDKNTTIGSGYVYMANRTVTTQTDELVLYFIIPDDLIFKIAKSASTVVMVNLANSARVEDTVAWQNKSFFNGFIYEKQKNKTLYPNLNR